MWSRSEVFHIASAMRRFPNSSKISNMLSKVSSLDSTMRVERTALELSCSKMLTKPPMLLRT